MRARLSESPATKCVHAALIGVLPERWTGFNRLAFTAAIKSDRMLLKLLLLRPAATGLMGASLELIAGISSSTRAGSSPNKVATLLTAERRSRRRVTESVSSPSTTWRTSCRVTVVSAPPEEAFVLRLIFIATSFRELMARSEPVSGGHGLPGVDIRVFYHRTQWYLYLKRVFPIFSMPLTVLDNS